MSRSDETPRAQTEDEAFFLPASHAQARLWFLDQLVPGQWTYNLCFGLRLAGPLDIPAFHRSLIELLRRHESLRTRFEQHPEGVMQVVHPPHELALEQIDLASVDGDTQQAELDRVCRERMDRSFDLERDWLIRPTLIRLSTTEHVVLLVIHHIVFDGWSMGILAGELVALYQAFRENRPSPLPDLELQYADYSEWHRQFLLEPSSRGQLAYWRQKLSGELPVLQLPSDRPRPVSQSFRGAATRHMVPPELLRALEARAQDEGVTLFMLLLAALDILVHRYSGAEDVIVGTPGAGRNRAELEGIIGFFVNTLALRVSVRGDVTLRQLVREIRSCTLEAYDNQDVPFDKVVEELELPRDLSTSPVFQVMLALQNQRAPEIQLPGLKVSPVALERSVAPFDLFISAEESPEGLLCTSEYSTDLFDRPTIDRFFTHWMLVLEQIARHPDTRVDELDLLSADERRHLRHEWSRPASPFPAERCVHEWVEQTAARLPQAVAAVSADEEITYGELVARSDRLARRLRKAGVSPDVAVPLCIERSIDMLVGMLAILKAGGAVVPVDTSYPADRIAFLVEQSRGPVIVTVHGRASSLIRIGLRGNRVLCIDDPDEPDDPDVLDGPDHAGPADRRHRVAPGNLAYVIYTSGSTGQPKGVAMSHRAHSNLLEWQRQHSMAVAGTRTLQFASPSFDVSLQEIFSTWATGGTLVLASDDQRRDGDALLQLIASAGVERIFVPVVALHNLALAATRSPDTALYLREIVAAGEQLRLSDELRALLRRLPECRLLNHYGPTETHALSWWEQPDAIDRCPALPPIGRPLPNIRIYLLDSRHRPVPVGVAGELYGAGEGLARGYLARPDLTAERFLPDPFGGPGGRMYRTGDLARLLPDGNLEYLGRADRQVKIRGFRVELAEIEHVLAQHELVRENAVIAHEDPPGRAGAGVPAGKRLVAYVVAASSAPTATDLRSFARARLPDFMVPSAFVFLPALPVTSNNKLDRKALPPPSAGSLAPADLVLPRTATEQTVAAIWSELLELPHVSVTSSFFDLGGHSLLATRLVARIREKLGHQLPVRAVFEAPTVAGLAALCEQAAAPADAIARAPLGQPVPLSFPQERLWLLEQLGFGAAYVIPLALRLRGEVDEAALTGAIRTVHARHDPLRLRIVTGADGAPVQDFHPPDELDLVIQDLRSLPAADRRDSERELTLAVGQPLSVRQGPLFRARLVRTADTERILILSMHHLVTDGWSVNVLAQEVAQAYSALLRGQPVDLPALPVSYRDFALWQRRQQDAPESARSRDHWKGQLEGCAPLLRLPEDRPRPAVMTAEGATRARPLDSGLRRAVEEMARNQGVTPFCVLLSVFQLLVMRLSGRTEAPIGSPFSGRSRPELQPLIGLFVNTVVLRTDLSGDPAFRDLLARTWLTLQEAQAHADFPFERLVHELQPERSRSHAPVIQVMFAFNAVSARLPQLPGVEVDRIPLESQSAMFDLSCGVEETEDAWVVAMQYSTRLFGDQTIERWLSQYECLLRSAVGAPERRLSRLDHLPAEERAWLLAAAAGDRAGPYPTETIPRAFEAQVARTPDAIAVECQGVEVSYRALDERAGILAAALARSGVGEEQIVALFVKRSVEMVVGLLAILKANAAYLPIDPSLPRARIRQLLGDSGARWALSVSSLADDVSALDVRALWIDAPPPDVSPADFVPRDLHPDHPAYVLYTSGSTGHPKGVVVPHRGVVSAMRHEIEAYAVGPDARTLQFAPLSFDLSVVELLPALLSGSRVCLPPAELTVPGPALQRFIADQRITHIYLTPSTLSLLDDENLPALQTVAVGGEVCSAALAARWGRHHRFLNAYGPTEGSIVNTIHACSGLETEPPPIGRPIPHNQLHVVDRDGGLAGIGVPGELHIGGVAVARGYLHRPDLTAERFIPDAFSGVPGARLYRTGDRARWREDSTLEFLGRLDDQVKLRGVRIEPAEVKAALEAHPSVRDAVVLVRGEERGERRLVAYVLVSAETATDSAAVSAFLRERLPAPMVPSAIVPVLAWPRTPAGKLDTANLPVVPTPRRDQPARGRDQFELGVADLFMELLDRGGVGPEDDFFALGGHSLLAVRLLAEVERRFGVEIPFAALYEAASVESLAERLRVSRAAPVAASLVPLAPEAGGVPLYFVHPVGGSVLCYQALARALSPHLRLIGIPAAGLERGETPRTSVEEMAEAYLRAIRAAQPGGPYLLGGWSLGGVIAYEIAVRLRLGGQDVARLILIDSYAPDASGAPDPADERWVLRAFVEDLLEGREPSTPAGPRATTWDHVVQQAVEAGIISARGKADRLRRVYEAFLAHVRALRAYRPSPLDAPVMWIDAAGSRAGSAAASWASLVRGAPAPVQIDASHHGLLRAGAVDAVARTIRDAISRTDIQKGRRR